MGIMKENLKNACARETFSFGVVTAETAELDGLICVF